MMGFEHSNVFKALSDAGWGRTFGGESSFYLFLGRPGNQARSGFH